MSLRLANLMALSHPYSVDLYAEQTVRGIEARDPAYAGRQWNIGATVWNGLRKKPGERQSS